MKCADQKSGYMYFLKNHFWIQHPTKGAMVFQPFDYQEGLAKNMHENRLSCNLLSRQLGKCVSHDTLITIRNPTTGNTYGLTMGQWYDILMDVSLCDPSLNRQKRLIELTEPFKIT